MLDYLQKFKQLPQEVRNKISNKETNQIISDLEKKYDLDLVSTVIKVATKDISARELESYFINEMGVPKDRARDLEEELNKKIFVRIKDHLQAPSTLSTGSTGSPQASSGQASSGQDPSTSSTSSEQGGSGQREKKEEEGDFSSQIAQALAQKKKREQGSSRGGQASLNEKDEESGDSEEILDLEDLEKEGEVEKDQETEKDKDGKDTFSKKRKRFLPKRKRTRKLMAGEDPSTPSTSSGQAGSPQAPSTPSTGSGQASSGQGSSGQGSSGKKQEKEKREKEKESHADSSDSDKKSGDFFSSEDEKEIKEISQKVKGRKESKKASDDTQEKLKEVTKELDINFSSEATKERFEKILLTYLKGVRGQVDVRQTLAKEYNKGGLNLEEDTCDKIISVAKKYREAPEGWQNSKKENKSRNKEKSSAQKDLDAILEGDSKKQEQEGISSGSSDNEQKKGVSKNDSSDSKKEAGKDLDLGKMPERDVDYDLASALKQRSGQGPSTLSTSSGQGPSTSSGQGSSGQGKKKGEEKEASSSGKEDSEGKDLSKKGVSPVSRVVSKEKEEKASSDKQTEKQKKQEKKNSENFSSEEEQEKSISDNKAGKKETVTPEKKEEKLGKTKVRRTSPPEEKGKKKMEDIKKPPHLINPVNELKYMDLSMFRRLGSDADQRADKVKEKIDNLAQKYFSEKLEGIKAWRQSPVNRMYLQVGKESIVYNKTVNDIIKEKQRENSDYLNSEEFDAIMDLNNKLRFY